MVNTYDVIIPIKVKNFQDLNVTDAGFMLTPPNDFKSDSVHQTFIIHYITSGTGYYIVGNKTYQLHAGQIFIIRPFEEVCYYPDKDDPWSYIWIGFDGNMTSNLYDVDYVHDFPHAELFFNIRSSMNIHEYREEYLYSQLLLIYREIAPPENKGNYYVNIIMHQIHSSYTANPTIQELADYCNLNRCYATRLFKKETGMSINQYLISHKMKKAMEFLRTGYSVEDTAHMIGYSEYHSFTKKFTEFFGTPPSKFKQYLQRTDNNAKSYTPNPDGHNPFL